MATEWVCFKCHAPNEMSSKFCQVCSAVRPPGAEALVNEEEALLASGLGNGPENMQTQSFMLAGLASAIRDAASGRMKPREFRQRMEAAAQGVDEIFEAISYELSEIEEDSIGYSSVVENALEDARLLFQMALGQLEGYRGAKDNASLRVGMILAEKAEECYQTVRKGVEADASGHNLRGRADIVRSLGARLMEGSISREEYRAAIDEVDEAVHSWLNNAVELLEGGLGAAKVFDGSQYSALQKVGEMLENATNDFACVILAIHTPDSVIGAANQLKYRELEEKQRTQQDEQAQIEAQIEAEKQAAEEKAQDELGSEEEDLAHAAETDATTIDIAAFMQEINASANDFVGQLEAKVEQELSEDTAQETADSEAEAQAQATIEPQEDNSK